MLSNQISFATDDMTSLLQNPISDFSEMYTNYPTPFDVYINNNNNTNLYIPPNSPPQSSTPTQNTTNVTFTSFPLSHVKVSNSGLEEEDSAFLESITMMDQEFIRALDDITLSSPSSPEMNAFMTPPTDDSPTKTDAPAPMWHPPVQYPRKLVTPVGLNELPNLVAFPPDMQVSKRLFIPSPDLAQLYYPLLQQQHQQRMYQQQMQHQQMQQQQQAMYEINNYMMQQQLQKMQQQQDAMKVHKTQSFPEERFRHQAAMYEQQFVPYTHDDGLVPQPPKLHKVRSNEEYPTPEAIATAMAMKKRRTLARRSSCSDITRSPGRPRSNSSPANSRRPRARSISSVIQDPEVEAMLSDPNLNPQTPSESRFRLLHEPNPQQRKSYQNENRYLAPSPLIVMARVPEAVSGGAVSVRAVHAGDYTDFPKNVLGESELKQNLDDGGKAHFVMKCAETTGNQQVRLKFSVRYVSGQVLYEEVIYSQAFYISSHTGKRTEMPSI